MTPLAVGNELPKTPCPVCEGAGWDWKKAADDDLQVDDPVDTYWCEPCQGTGTIPADEMPDFLRVLILQAFERTAPDR